jgi:hypothetical protein
MDAELRSDSSAVGYGWCSGPNPASAYKFELYDVRHDWTQYSDVSAKYPQKVQEMKDLMFGEFSKYNVLPLDASVATRAVAARPSLSAGRKVLTYSQRSREFRVVPRRTS